MSYLIRDGEPVAQIGKGYKSGAVVRYAYDSCDETMDADREVNLVNTRTAFISNATEVNDGEFLVASVGN